MAITIETKYHRAEIILFKPSGKYYTTEYWEIPDIPEARYTPTAMMNSPDYRTIGGGAVLVTTQKPWGYPWLRNAEEKHEGN